VKVYREKGRENMIFAGCDVGSLTGEAVIMEDSSILSSSIIRVRTRPEQTALEVTTKALEKLNLTVKDISYCVSTGYGRDKIPFAGSSISEISCHGKGAQWANPGVRTIIDIGGQDCKVIKVDKYGYMVDFVMNDKCAAGTGRFLEGMARVLGVSLEDLAPLSQSAARRVALTKTCTVLSQIEVIHMLSDGIDRSEIAAGINFAMADRISKLAKRVGIKEQIAITGGVAKNFAVVNAIREVLDIDFASLGEVDPQIVGALGAAIIAQERWRKDFQRSDGVKGISQEKNSRIV
jgi:(R)-2-hydroxyacyl-CoA dehydratese activating ATPase